MEGEKKKLGFEMCEDGNSVLTIKIACERHLVQCVILE